MKKIGIFYFGVFSLVTCSTASSSEAAKRCPIFSIYYRRSNVEVFNRRSFELRIHCMHTNERVRFATIWLIFMMSRVAFALFVLSAISNQYRIAFVSLICMIPAAIATILLRCPRCGARLSTVFSKRPYSYASILEPLPRRCTCCNTNFTSQAPRIRKPDLESR